MAGEAAETEKVVEKQPSEFKPKSYQDGIDKFFKDQAEKPSEEAVKVQPEGKPEETLEKKDEECPECEKEKQAKAKVEAEKAAAKPKPSWFLTDDKGKKIPAVLKVDGKEIVIDDPEKFMTWAQLGIHSNVRLEEIKKAEGMIKQIMTAIEQGRIEVKDGKLTVMPKGAAKASEAEATEEPEAGAENEDYLSPEVRAANKKIAALEASLAETKKMVDVLGMSVADDYFKKQKGMLDDEIAKFKPKFPLAKDKDIWDLLKIVENDRPKYSVEGAMQKAHEEHLADFTKFRDDHPEFVGKQEIIARYLKEKGEKEAAPISKPSPETTTSPKTEKPKYKNLSDSIAAFQKDQETALRAKDKF